MALWQVEFYAIDKERTLESDFDDILLWGKNLSSILAENVLFLPKENSWDNTIVQFGRNDETCIEIIKDSNNMIQEISIRLDLRTISIELIEHIVDYLNKLDCNIYYDGRIYKVSKKTLKSIIVASNAYRFCKNPIKYFEDQL